MPSVLSTAFDQWRRDVLKTSGTVYGPVSTWNQVKCTPDSKGFYHSEETTPAQDVVEAILYMAKRN